jgi:hypothetical protein
MSSALQRVASGATQTTQIEQARATADVLAAMEAAKRWPRDEQLAELKMRTACQRQLVADKAFWSFKRSGELLTGSTIHLARTIGAIWTNFQWGIAELSRDDHDGVSQMIAWAWDLETNTRNSTAFIVPHARDTKDGRKKITALRDIYESNANNGARRVRQMITDLLPDWYVETAEDICRNVIEGSDQPVEKIRAEVATALKPLGVELPRVLARVGRSAWNETTRGDLATLRIIAKTIARGEATAREQFPEPVVVREAVTVQELTGVQAAPAAAPVTTPATTPATAPEPGPEPAPADDDRADEYAALMAEEELRNGGQA